MADITKTEYAPFLEGFCNACMEHKPIAIGVAALLPDGSVFTNYFGDCNHADKAFLAYHMGVDAMIDVVKANAKTIVEAAQDEGGEDDG